MALRQDESAPAPSSQDEGLTLLAQLLLFSETKAFVGTLTANFGRLVHLLMGPGDEEEHGRGVGAEARTGAAPTVAPLGHLGGAFDMNCGGLVSMRDGRRVAGTGPRHFPPWKSHCKAVDKAQCGPSSGDGTAGQWPWRAPRLPGRRLHRAGVRAG